LRLCDVMTTIGVVFVRHGTRIKLIAILFAYRRTVQKLFMHQSPCAVHAPRGLRGPDLAADRRGSLNRVKAVIPCALTEVPVAPIADLLISRPNDSPA